MKSKKTLLAIIAIAIIGGIIGYNYIYQDHRDIESEKAAYTVKAADFIKEFQANEEEATTKYLNKTIAVEGILTSIDGNTVVIGDVIFFALSENETPPTSDKISTAVQVKARCIGYDSLLEEVKLDQATVH
jgi:hypothetical protein